MASEGNVPSEEAAIEATPALKLFKMTAELRVEITDLVTFERAVFAEDDCDAECRFHDMIDDAWVRGHVDSAVAKPDGSNEDMEVNETKTEEIEDPEAYASALSWSCATCKRQFYATPTQVRERGTEVRCATCAREARRAAAKAAP